MALSGEEGQKIGRKGKEQVRRQERRGILSSKLHISIWTAVCVCCVFTTGQDGRYTGRGGGPRREVLAETLPFLLGILSSVLVPCSVTGN